MKIPGLRIFTKGSVWAEIDDRLEVRPEDFVIWKKWQSSFYGTDLLTILGIERQQPVIFRDALNRVAPFHLEFINSHEAFFAVLEIRFKDVGINKVRRREFALQNAGATTDIDLRKPWEASFVPDSK